MASLEGEYLVYDDGFRPRSYSYPTLARAARNFALRLERAGIGRGDRIIIWSENRPAWVAAFWGAVLRGVAVAPIEERHSLDFLRRVESVIEPKAILVGDEVKLPPRPRLGAGLAASPGSTGRPPTPTSSPLNPTPTTRPKSSSLPEPHQSPRA